MWCIHIYTSNTMCGVPDYKILCYTSDLMYRVTPWHVHKKLGVRYRLRRIWQLKTTVATKSRLNVINNTTS